MRAPWSSGWRSGQLQTGARPEVWLTVPDADRKGWVGTGAGRGGCLHQAWKAWLLGKESTEHMVTTHTHTWTCQGMGEGCSVSRSLSLLSCKMGMTDTSLDNEPQSIP